VIEQQRASESASLVVGMRGYAEEFEHGGFDVARCSLDRKLALAATSAIDYTALWRTLPNAVKSAIMNELLPQGM
jgi:hypothetical protein